MWSTIFGILLIFGGIVLSLFGIGAADSRMESRITALVGLIPIGFGIALIVWG